MEEVSAQGERRGATVRSPLAPALRKLRALSIAAALPLRGGLGPGLRPGPGGDLGGGRPQGIHAADLDGDGDLDVLSASFLDDRFAWYENLGAGAFGPQQVLSDTSDYAWDVGTADVDGDGDLDVVTASYLLNELAWFENLGAAAFGPKGVISQDVRRPGALRLADLDGDGDDDVLATAEFDDEVVWFESLGSGAFGPKRVISSEKASRPPWPPPIWTGTATWTSSRSAR